MGMGDISDVLPTDKLGPDHFELKGGKAKGGNADALPTLTCTLIQPTRKDGVQVFIFPPLLARPRRSGARRLAFQSQSRFCLFCTMKNVTVDDSSANNITLIPTTCNGTGWQFERDRGFEGSGYRWCASSEGPKASFEFKGVAIYYSCPSFTGDFMQFVLDGGSPENVNLSSPLTPQLRSNSSIVWWKTGLDFKTHTLEISPGENSTRVYVDAFVYTTLEAQEIASLVGAKPSTSAVSAQNPDPERIANRAPIAVFSIVGFIVLTIFLLISFNLYRTSKARRAQYSWKVPVPPLHQSEDYGASLGGVVKQTDSVPYQGGHESSLGHTASAYQSPQPSYGSRPLPAAPGQARPEWEDDLPSQSPFVAATDLRTRRMDSVPEQATYPPPQSPMRTDTSYSSTPKFAPNRRPRG